MVIWWFEQLVLYLHNTKGELPPINKNIMAAFFEFYDGRCLSWYVGQPIPVREGELNDIKSVQVDGHEKAAGKFEINFPTKCDERVSRLTWNAARAYTDHMGQIYGWKSNIVDMGDLTEFHKMRNEMAIESKFREAFEEGHQQGGKIAGGFGDPNFNDFESWWEVSKVNIFKLIK